MAAFIIVLCLIIGKQYYVHEMNEPVFQQDEKEAEKKESGHQELDENSLEKKEEDRWIMIDIYGEVSNPGVIKLAKGARMIDVIEKAGGLLETADRNQVNMARIVSDEEQIYIPKIGENIENHGTTSVHSLGTSSVGKVNINTASPNELESLDGVGKVLAERIAQYREENGLFKDITDIMKVPGIGEKKFKNIQEHIEVH